MCALRHDLNVGVGALDDPYYTSSVSPAGCHLLVPGEGFEGRIPRQARNDICRGGHCPPAGDQWSPLRETNSLRAGRRGGARRLPPWREKGAEGVAAVDKIEDKRKPDDFIGHRNRMPTPTGDDTGRVTRPYGE